MSGIQTEVKQQGATLQILCCLVGHGIPNMSKPGQGKSCHGESIALPLWRYNAVSWGHEKNPVMSENCTHPPNPHFFFFFTVKVTDQGMNSTQIKKAARSSNYYQRRMPEIIRWQEKEWYYFSSRDALILPSCVGWMLSRPGSGIKAQLQAYPAGP